jgi:hypothetical protein
MFRKISTAGFSLNLLMFAALFRHNFVNQFTNKNEAASALQFQATEDV